MSTYYTVFLLGAGGVIVQGGEVKVAPSYVDEAHLIESFDDIEMISASEEALAEIRRLVAKEMLQDMRNYHYSPELCAIYGEEESWERGKALYEQGYRVVMGAKRVPLWEETKPIEADGILIQLDNHSGYVALTEHHRRYALRKPGHSGPIGNGIVMKAYSKG